MTKLRARISSALIAVAVLLPASLALGSETVYFAPEVREDPDLLELLYFKVTVDHESGSTLDWSNTRIVRDGSPIRLYFRSSRTAPSYGFCFKFSFEDGDRVRTRHYCDRWRDSKLHSIEILSASEARRLSSFRLHTYDVRGVPRDWDGSGDPPGMLAHDIEDYSLKDATIVSASIDALKSAVTTSAKGVLLCAHPSATYKGVSIDDLRLGDSVGWIDFTIAYQCEVLRRPCSMSLRAKFKERRFEALSVTSDTALTNATVGLDVCEALIRDAIDAIRH
ncbi:MAG: hypothetical protein H6711_14240 [Myxococcales bacterium]|nr:hypothetical protein [Myxococcales bacterium]